MKTSTKSKITVMNLAHRKFMMLKSHYNLLSVDLSGLWSGCLSWAWRKVKDVKYATILLNHLDRVLGSLSEVLSGDLGYPIDLSGWRLSKAVNKVIEDYNTFKLNINGVVIQLQKLQLLSL
jgi:hypothetical protein